MATPKDLVGKWKHVKDDNFDKFLDHIGAGAVVKKAASTLHPLIEIEGDDASITLSVKPAGGGPVAKKETVVVGQEGTHEAPHGKVTGTANIEGADGLVMRGKDEKGRSFVSKRRIEGNQLIMTLNCDGVEATRYFERA